MVGASMPETNGERECVGERNLVISLWKMVFMAQSKTSEDVFGSLHIVHLLYLLFQLSAIAHRMHTITVCVCECVHNTDTKPSFSQNYVENLCVSFPNIFLA